MSSWLAFAGLMLLGQVEENPAGGAILQALPADFRWKVEVEEARVRGQEAPRSFVRSIEVDRTRQVRRNLLEWSDGQKTEEWFVPHGNGTFLLQDNRNGGGIAYLQLDAAYGRDPKADWPELAWVERAKRLEDERVEGVKMMVFEVGEENGQKQKVWVHPETRRPMIYDDGFYLHRYTYLGPPRPVSLPDRFREALADHDRRAAAEQKRRLLVP